MMISSRLTLVATVILTLVSACATKQPQVKDGHLDFALPDLEGEIIASSDDRFEGKVRLVTLWGTWCPPCVSEIPTFNDLQHRYADAGLTVVGIAFERDTLAVDRRKRLREFSQEHAIGYLVLDGGATSDFSTALPMVEDAKGLPIEIIIDRSGQVVDCRSGYGYKEEWARALEDRLQRLLSEDR